jgi:hypothetical protein
MVTSGSLVMKAELYVTTRCLGECPFCFGQGDFGKDGSHVPVEKLLTRAGILLAYHEKHPFWCVPLLGGEPLLHPGLPELVRAVGRSLPLAIVSAGQPDEGAALGDLLPHVDMWGATYNVHLCGRYISYVNALLAAGKTVETIMHFHDVASFRAVNAHFVTEALPRLHGVSARWKRGFHAYLASWTDDTFYSASFRPFSQMDDDPRSMVVRYSIIDRRFTRHTSRQFEPPYFFGGERYPCYLFADLKSIAITEEGRVLPCTSNAQRHSAPIIEDIDSYGRLPDDLPDWLDRCGAILFPDQEGRVCDVRCKHAAWSLDR